MKKKELRRISQHFLFLEKQLSWILKARPCGIALRELLPLIHHLHNVFQHRGFGTGLLYIKAVRGNYLNRLTGNSHNFDGVKLTKEGLPVCFGPLLKYFRVISSREMTANTATLQLINTILFSTRALKGNPQPDIATICGPSKRGTSYIGMHWMARDFWRYLGYRHQEVVPRALKFRRFHFTTKTGPNGHALGAWWYDLISLPNQLRESIVTLGGERIRDFMSMALGLYSWSEELVWDGVKMLKGINPSGKPEEFYIRRLTYFADKEGKTRVIAILDYFSQTVLRGLHIYLFKLLKKIPQDMTFDQGAFVDKVKDWPVFYSVDLSSATDRFPIDLIAGVLRGHLPASYVSAWKDIMVGYPFEFHNGAPGLTSDNYHYYDDCGRKGMKYSVGNPMGAYSSWASFAVAHHYIFYFISRMQNKEWKSLRYVLLGDDILIGDEEVAKLYLEIIQDLGVDVSMAKTHVSKTTCEFAKRWLHRGSEISPFPISALKNCGKKYYFLTALLMRLEERGWVWESGISQVVSDFYGMILSRPARFCKSIQLKSYTTEQIMRIIWGAKPADCMNNIVRQLGHTDIYFDDDSALQLLSNIAVDLFSRSMPDVKKGKPLGQIAEELVLFITSKLEECPEAMTLLENPTLHAYGSIEQTYIDLLNKARDIDVARKGDWPLLLRAMTIPLSDALFLDRSEQTDALGVSQIGRMLVDRIGIVRQYPSMMEIEQAIYPTPEARVPREPGILDPLTSSKEEVEKVTGLKPAAQLDPSNFVNLEFSSKRSKHLSKPGSRMWKPAIPSINREDYFRGFLYHYFGLADSMFDDLNGPGTPKSGGPKGPKPKVSWSKEDRNRRMITWLKRHGIDANMYLSELSRSFVEVTRDLKDYELPSAGVKWDIESRRVRMEKAVRKFGFFKITCLINRSAVRHLGYWVGIPYISYCWLKVGVRRFSSWLRGKLP